MGSKSPRAARTPGTDKIPRQQEKPESIYNQRPSWLLKHVDLENGPFPWAEMQLHQLRGLIGRLSAFEKMTWLEIEKQKSSHSMSQDRICKEARDRLEQLELAGENLYQLHIAGAARVWGLRFGAAVALLWWDPEHKVYPVEKKHT